MKDRVTRLQQSGFTVVEIMIVIAVIGILAAFAVPNFLAWLPGYQLKSAARDMQGDFQRAKFESIQRGGPVTVAFNLGVGSAGGYTIFIDGNGNNTFDAGEVLIKQVGMPGQINLQAVSVGSLAFNSRGMVTTLVERIMTLSNTQGTVAEVRINPSGRVLIRRSVGGGPFQNWD